MALTLTLLLHFTASSQIYPVQTNISTTGPYYNYLSYYADENNHLQAVVTLTDFNSGPIQARLRVRIEGPGYQAYTNPNLNVGVPFTLDPGVPQFLNGFDLAPYLQAQNLIVTPSGVDLNALPEGFTTICIDVIRDGTSQEILSTNNCSSFFLQRFQPSQAVFPVCESNVGVDETFYTFQWTPPIGYVPSIGTELNYTFSLYEWNDPTNFSIFQSGQGLVHIEQTTSALVQLSQFDVMLQEGKQYVWRVEAQLSNFGMPIDMIENNGLSEPCSFTYGESTTLEELLTDGLYIDIDASGEGERKGNAYWTVIDNTPGEGLSTFDAYIVEYRKKPTGNEGFELTWFEDTVTSFNLFMYQLEPITTYEVKVSGMVGNHRGESTEVAEFTTNDLRDYACGDQDLPYLLPSFNPLQNAQAGMYFEIGQFTMQVTEITPGGVAGVYDGKGLIPIAFIGGAKAKVKFEGIMVDDQFVVREGQVDVVTDGLDNWLNQQYLQFVDPIYIDGTIDSAYVEGGSAWVIVDGQPLEFVFDPVDAPIILNDENGVQYTIWPDGTIVIGTYLNISNDTLSVGADSVAIFAQSTSETFGFDGKEHIEWHENYEVIQLTDSSLYFVANKSVGEGATDVVNAVIPSGMLNVTFELNGSTLTSSPLAGGLREVTLPSNLSKGQHALYVNSGNLRIGKLNVMVYKAKSKKVHLVPMTSATVDTVAIASAIQGTFGEANIQVELKLLPQWNDTLYTSSKSIQLPTDVGLMNKYSEDMKGLRDAFFKMNPHLSKNHYYVFVVPSFNDATVDGYMVRGKALGFVASGEDAETYAHELGHGIGALEHSWKNAGPSMGTTDNLMDYGLVSNQLVKSQWKELRDLDVAPSIMDGEEESMSSNMMYLANFDAIVPSNSGYQIISQGSITESEVMRLKSGTFIQFPTATRSKFTDFVFENGLLIALKNGEKYLTLSEDAYIVQQVVHDSYVNYTSDAMTSSLAFMCADVTCVRDTFHVAFDDSIRISVGYLNSDVLGDELYFPECLEFDGIFFTGLNGNNNPIYNTYICPPEAGGCVGSERSTYTQAEKIAVYDRFKAIVESGAQDWSVYNAIEFTDGNIVLDDKARKVIEEKVRTLRKYRPDLHVGLVSMKLTNGPIMDKATVEQLAEDVVDSLKISYPNETLILFLNVVKEGSQPTVFGETHYSCRSNGFGRSDVNRIENGFISSDIANADVKKAFLTLFSKIYKPYYITNIYELHDGSKVVKVINRTAAGKDLPGYPFVHGAKHLVSLKKETYDNLRADLDAIIADYSNDEFETNGAVNSNDYVNDPNYQLKLSLFEQWAELAEQEDAIDDPTKWKEGEVKFDELREHYLDEKLALSEYVKQKSGEEFLINTVLAMDGSVGELTAGKYYGFSVMNEIIDPMIYGGLDVLGLIPGVDCLSDAAGLLYATARGDGESAFIYGAALTLPFMSGGTVRAGKKLYGYYAKKNALGEIDIFVKSADDDLTGFVKISNDIPCEVSEGTSVKNYMVSKIDEFDDDIVRKVVALKGGVHGVDDLIRGVSRNDFVNSVGDFASNPQLADEAWDLFKNEDWAGLESFVNTNNINGGWPPNNGFKNITHTETGPELSGKTFDRFQNYQSLGGGFASPVNTGEGVGDLVFTYDSRALSTQIPDGTYYVKFELKNNLPSDLSFEYGEAIPWFNAAGNADQIKSSYNFVDLVEGVHYDVIERFVYQNGQWLPVNP